MKNIFKKAVALFCVLLTFCGILAAPAAAAYEKDLPIIYLVGAIEVVYDKNGKQVWPVTQGIEDILMDNSTELIAAFSASLMTSDWSIYGAALDKAIDKYFSAGITDKNGNAKNGTDINHSVNPQKKTSNFKLGDYRFRYDPRLDPWATVKELDSFVDAVLKATGKKKVNFVGRCMGSCILAAYLCRYGSSKVENALFYSPAVNGATNCSELFAGKVHIDADVLNNYANNYMGGNEIDDLLSSVINVTYTLNMLGMGTDVATQIFEQLSLEVFPELLRSTYAQMPSYWAMVSEEYYEEAKNFVFGGKEAEYAELIRKIDFYHENVKLRIGSTLKTYNKNGLKVNVIAKYNKPMPPYLESYSVQGDGTVNIGDISFGAIGADIGNTLSVEYLNAAKKGGTIYYISDDLIVDASTCLFPDYTWFVRDVDHGYNPTCIDALMMDIFHTKNQATIKTFEKYPQFLVFNQSKNTITPVTGPVSNGSSSGTQSSAWQRLINIFLSFFNIIKNFFSIIK